MFAASVLPVSAATFIYSQTSCTNNVCAHVTTATPAVLSASGTFTAAPPTGLALDAWYLLDHSPTAAEMLGTNALASAARAVYPGNYSLYLNFSQTPVSSMSGNCHIIPAYSWLRYRLVYDAGGASGTPPAAAVHIYTNRVTVASASSLSRPGYSLRGWGTTASGGSIHRPGAVVTGAALGATTNGLVTLYACWTQNVYSVAFRYRTGDSGTAASSVVSVNGTENASAPASSVVDRWTGHVFTGWDAAFTGVVSNMTVNALYRECGYKVVFDGNGGSGGMSAMSLSYSRSSALTANAFTRTGYAFSGWNTKADGSGTSYADGATVSKLTAADGGTVTLYAQWTGREYELAYDNLFICLDWRNSSSSALASTADGAALDLADGWLRISTGAKSHVRTVYGASSSYCNIPVSPQTEYAFFCSLTGDAPSSEVYWVALDSGFAVIKNGTLNYSGMGRSGGAKSYAKTFTTPANCAYVQLFFDVHDAGETETFSGIRLCKADPWGETSVFPVRSQYTYSDGGTYADAGVTLPSPMRTGYSFAGWYDSETGGQHVLEDSPSSARSTALYSSWNENSYTVVFESAGGSGQMSAQSFMYSESKPLRRNSYVRQGYSFEGWNTAADGSGTSYADGATVASLASDADATVVLYARWREHSYAVEFNANSQNASGSMSPQQLLYDESRPLPPCAFAVEWFDFDGWNTEADGSGTSYGDGQTVSRLASADGAVVVLYAQWKESDAYWISFDSGGGEGEMPVVRVLCGEDTDLPPCAFTRTGYAFNTWTNSLGEAVRDGATVSDLAQPGETARLFATWTPNSYTIRFDVNGMPPKDVMVNNSSYDAGAEFDSPHELEDVSDGCGFAVRGYSFDRWTRMPDGSGGAFTNRETVLNLATNGNDVVVLFAQWTANRYTVVFDGNGGTGEMDPLQCVYDTGYTLPSNAFTRAGHAFRGWLSDGSDIHLRDLADGQTVSNLTCEADVTVTLAAQWEDESGDLKDVLDIPVSVRDAVSVWVQQGGWSRTEGSGDMLPKAGDSFMTAGGGMSDLCMRVSGGGALSFWWGVKDTKLPRPSDQKVLYLYLDGEKIQSVDGVAGKGGWPETGVTVDLSDLNGEHTVMWRFQPSSPETQTAYLDCVGWGPAAPADEPTEADRPVVTSAGMEDGSFSLSLISTGALRYILEASDTLAPPAWEPFRTNDVEAAGVEVFFGELSSPDRPQRFFRVRAAARGDGGQEGE